MSGPRFPMDATTYDEAVHYFTQRAIQGLMDGFRWTHQLDRLVEGGAEWGLRTQGTSPQGAPYQSVFVYLPHRGQGHLSRHARRDATPFVTTPNCAIEAYFSERGIQYVLAGAFAQTPEYEAITAFYGDTRAARSRRYYMNHIDEGLAVLRWLGASDRAMRAWCLHPMVQLDRDLATTYGASIPGMTSDPHVLLLAMEYRNIANAFLSGRRVNDANEIALSPLDEVNDMLRADKVQNYKDFLLEHRETHPRRKELDVYFRLWLKRLSVSRTQFERWFTALQVDATPVEMPKIEAF